MRRTVFRRRDFYPGFRTKQVNLNGDAKGKGTSGHRHEAESTDASFRIRLPHSSDEVGVMPMERRGRVIAVALGQPEAGRA